MTQKYQDPRARQRMAEGRCPECGKEENVHTGWGAVGCSLTDYGVADRIFAYRMEEEERGT